MLDARMRASLIATLAVLAQMQTTYASEVVSSTSCLAEKSCTRSSMEGAALLQTTVMQQHSQLIEEILGEDEYNQIEQSIESYMDFFGENETSESGFPGITPSSSSSSSVDEDDGGLGGLASSISSSGRSIDAEVDRMQTAEEESKKRDCIFECTFKGKQCAGAQVAAKVQPLISCVQKCRKDVGEDLDKRKECYKAQCTEHFENFKYAIFKKMRSMDLDQRVEVWGCSQRKCIEGQCHEGAKPQKAKKVKKFLKKLRKLCEVDTCMKRHGVSDIIGRAYKTKYRYQNCSSTSYACKKEMKQHKEAWKRSKLQKSLKKAFKAVKNCSKTSCKDQAAGILLLNRRECARRCAQARCFGKNATELNKKAKACSDNCVSEHDDMKARGTCMWDNCTKARRADIKHRWEIWKKASDEDKAKIKKCIKEKCVQKECKDFTKEKGWGPRGHGYRWAWRR
eukprot:gnl/TRDRNA2_/TRDRNA2_162760_c0_seq2.p1 gnl/TRDRNA2_/TRDRNA2_162760_c0~~gnl/TRDRNA2_/TRDRNA2_162760_c0_seq2.p1  ORF type:complete len:453 (-),score=108.03 gnl/TRDRNA2_/TRDRNA2_162760_c0_seq2:119-1477(-)